MTISQKLEQDREKLLGQMRKATSPDKMQKVLSKELDRLLYMYLEDEEEEGARREAQGLFETAKAAMGWLGAWDEPEIWERKVEPGSREGAGREARPYRIYAVFLAAIGLILMVASFVMPMFQQKMKFSLVALLLLLGGAVLVFLAGLRFIRPKDKLKSEYRTVIKLDPDEVYTHLSALVLVIEQSLTDLQNEKRAAKDKDQTEAAVQLDRASIELFAGLLEAALSKDGDYALSEAKKVRFYLHNRGIETVDYSDETRTMFDVIPVGPADTYSLGEKKEGNVTLRPALVSGSNVLKKGLAGKQA